MLFAAGVCPVQLQPDSDVHLAHVLVAVVALIDVGQNCSPSSSRSHADPRPPRLTAKRPKGPRHLGDSRQ